MSDLRIDLPCGCSRAVVKRMVPAFDPRTGAALLNAAGEFVLEEQDDTVDSFCPEHSGALILRQQAALAALAAGDQPAALKIMAGAESSSLLPSCAAEDE